MGYHLTGCFMNTFSPQDDPSSHPMSAPKWGLVIATVLNLCLLLPFFSFMAFFSVMIFDGKITPWVGWFFVYGMRLLPLSIPVSFFCIWANYSRGKLKHIQFFYFLPLIAFIVLWIFTSLFQAIF